MATSFLGLDVGTGAAKAAVFEGGRRVGLGHAPYPLHTPQAGWAELDPQEVMGAVQAALAAAVREAGEEGASPVQALAISAQGEAAVCLDAKGEPIAPILVTFDSRAEEEARHLARRYPPSAFYRLTGLTPSSIHTAPKAAWLARHRPEVMARTRHYLCMQDWIGFWLTGRAAIDVTLAHRTALWNRTTGDWSEDLLGYAGLRREQLAEVVPSGTPIGPARAERVRPLGLPREVQVVAGAHDQAASWLGSGAVRPGSGSYSSGTVDCVAAAFVQADPERLRRSGYCWAPSPDPARHLTLAFSFSGGSLVNWLRDLLELDEPVLQAFLNQGDPRPSGLLVAPYWAGSGTPYLDRTVRGAVLGFTLASGRKELVHGVLEGLALELALNLEVLSGAGIAVDRLHAVGGGSRSDLALAIKASVTGLPVVRMAEPEGAALGAAILAGVGVGAFSGVEEAARALTREERVFLPDPALQEAYAPARRVYRDLYPTLRRLERRMLRA